MLELAGINYERRGTGAPLLLVHGIGSRMEVWRPVMDLLAARHEVIAVDLPGFGTSPSPPKGTPAGIDSLVAALDRFVAELACGRVHVAGNSLGGWIALELARRNSILSATALSPGGFHRGKDRPYVVSLLSVQRLAAQATRGLAPKLFRSVTARKLGWANIVAHPERMTPEDATLGVQGMADAAWFWETFYSVIRDSFKGGTEITAPVTIAWGDKDHLLLPHQASRALAQIPSASFVSLPDCGHVPMYDNPQLVADTILATTARAAREPATAG